MIYATYRCLYGEDFIQESIKSIESHVDKIFIFWDDIPWGNVDSCVYRGETVIFPKKFDNIIEKIKELNSNKVILIKDHVENNNNQFTHFVNDYILPNYKKPDTIIFIETDHVFHENEIVKAINEFTESNYLCASTSQIEHWKTQEYSIPFRNRLSTVFWNMKNLEKMVDTGRHANVDGMPMLSSYVHNFGFCVSEKVMLWKHLTAIAFSQKIGDTEPNHNWYENTWMNWDYNQNNSNLEISAGYEHLIPRADYYDINNLPTIIKEKYNYGKN